MICFRDMTFCSAKCDTKACPRQFDEKQKAAAARWWGGDDAPVAFSDFREGCRDYTKPVRTDSSRNLSELIKLAAMGGK